MSDELTRGQAEDLLFREAHLLDTRQWAAWLELYREDAVFWMPAWRDETSLTDDPDVELSLIYYQSRANLEERVWRLQSGQSVASQPLPRSVHQITNVIVADAPGGFLVLSSFTVHLFDVRSRRTHVFFGRYEHRLVREAGELRIAGKKIILLNDVIPTVVDIYAL